jgi:hypothetical protein
LSARRVLALLLIPYVLWLVFAYRYHFIDGANLLFHEAGHVFFGFFGQVIGILGGTLGQLFFPIVCIVYFYRRQQKFESAVCGIWLGESMMYMAEYMGDAQRQVLPLVGNGHRIHDWHFLLSYAGLLPSTGTLAALSHGIASTIAIAGVVLAILYSKKPESDD